MNDDPVGWHFPREVGPGLAILVIEKIKNMGRIWPILNKLMQCICFGTYRFPIVEPDPGHTKLRLSREGLDVIERITTPIAAVAVIGPYRSGKSFLLNQLLSLSCYEGFGVGHMRDTKTKGIWVWGTPVELDIDGVRNSVFYLDTEGFESVGKSNVYDDRIFALANVMSSVLIYNLPETIREADISRLSFAVELAEEFYGRKLKHQLLLFLLSLSLSLSLSSDAVHPRKIIPIKLRTGFWWVSLLKSAKNFSRCSLFLSLSGGSRDKNRSPTRRRIPTRGRRPDLSGAPVLSLVTAEMPVPVLLLTGEEKKNYCFSVK
ncbi:uncharacterized protein LOC132165778 [Corylus avellana]|uniref:uncharacterized protein LOC132165778 n=1 Tax=Corylus avellana TaxID=13451 RepID=UPI00286C1C17|nr:uncharacterized protein LOC132165778 [Corylus avellana]